MKKETGLPKLGMHKFITIFYLPLTIAFCLFAALGNTYDIGRQTFTTVEGLINAFILMLPFVTVLLFTLTLVGLLGLTHFGWRAVLFSTTFRILMMLVIIFGEMKYGKTEIAVIYSIACLINILIYAYYRRRAVYFVVGGMSLKDAYEMQKRSTMPSSSPITEEKTHEEVPAETEEKPEEEESTPSEHDDKEEETSSEDAETVIVVSDAETEYTPSDITKICRIFYAPDSEKSVRLSSSVLDILKDRTMITLTVENTSDKEYTESDWVFMKDIHYTSKTPLKKGTTTIKTEINRPVDRIAIELEEVR